MKKNYVKVKKKEIDEEGGENQKMKESDYVQMSWERSDLEEVVIYTKEIKEKKERRVKKTYLV